MNVSKFILYFMVAMFEQSGKSATREAKAAKKYSIILIFCENEPRPLFPPLNATVAEFRKQDFNFFDSLFPFLSNR